MQDEDRRRANRLRRLAEELEDEGLAFDELVLDELDHALRPPVHERRVPSVGTVVEPTTDPGTWGAGTALTIVERPLGGLPFDKARRFADGLSSWVVRRAEADDTGLVFDRPAGSERDLVVLAAAFGATIVQRHPTGVVRVVGPQGVVRWDGVRWHHVAPVVSWIHSMAAACRDGGATDALRALLEFAVHDLGARGIGALFVYAPGQGTVGEARLGVPPPLSITYPPDLAPLRHVLAQVDGAAVFDAAGTLVELGVRLVPSLEAEGSVDGLRGMRHTSGRRYSYDDPAAIVIVVSEDGPVTVLRGGELVGSSAG